MVSLTSGISCELAVIVDRLEKANELVCAAHLQFVIDKLEMRSVENCDFLR